MKRFVADVTELRRTARLQTEQGAITEGYVGDRAQVVAMLNGALATELVCALRYRRHYFMADGPVGRGVAAEFLAHSNEELRHADLLAGRIVQLNGEPNFNPEKMTARSHAEYVEGSSLVDMIHENLVAERIAIDSYREMIAFVADDTTTRRLLESILAVEEEHAADMADLLVVHRSSPTRLLENGRPEIPTA